MTEITDGSATFAVEYRKATFHGMIMSFSGSFSSDGYPIDSATGVVRKDWHICDGTNGTPDLRDKFILGGNGSNNGATGGSAENTHKHLTAFGFDGNVAYGYGHSESTDEFNPAFGSETRVGQGFNSLISIDAKNTSGGAIRIAYTDNTTISIMPPYYTLSYIMKL